MDNNPQYKKYKWLNLNELALNMIPDNETLEQVLYFTAYCIWDKEKKEKHKKYVEALSKYGIHTVRGKFLRVTKRFNKCSMPITDMSPVITDSSILPDEIEYQTYEEKKTDVNIATKIVDYAYKGKYDHAYIVSADGDIAPAIEMVKNEFSDKKFTAVLPIGYSNQYLCQVCEMNVIKIEESHLKDAQLPDPVIISEDKSISKPPSWN